MNTHEKTIATKVELDRLVLSKSQKYHGWKNSAIFRKKILECISASMYPAAIAKKLKVKKSKVYYHLRVMERAGIIFRESNARPIFYRISPQIKAKTTQATMDQFLSARDEVLKPLIGHDRLMEVNTHAIKIRLNVLEGVLPELVNSSQMNNWKRSQTSIRVWGTAIPLFLNHTKTPNIVAQPPGRWGKNETENIAWYLALGEEIRKWCHIHYPGVKLDTPLIVDEHHWIEDPAQDQIIHEQKMSFEVGPAKVDGSPESGFETKDRLTMQDYRMMPLRMKELSHHFIGLKEEFKELKSQDETTQQLKKKVDALEGVVEKLTGMFEHLLNLLPSQVQQPQGDSGPPGEFYL